MADKDTPVSALNITQRWKEFITGYHARLQAALLYGISSGGSSEIAIKASSGGGVYAELQPSTESIGLLAASTAKIGALQPSTEVIGHIIADASTAPIGQVGGHTAFPTVQLVTTTSQAYAAGDLVGSAALGFTSVFRSTSVLSGTLQSIIVADQATQGLAAIDFVFFKTATTGTTYTNDAAFAPADGDLGKIIGTVSVLSNDYANFSNNGVATVRNIGMPITATTGTGISVAAVNRSTGPSWQTTSDVTVTLGILQD